MSPGNTRYARRIVLFDIMRISHAGLTGVDSSTVSNPGESMSTEDGDLRRADNTAPRQRTCRATSLSGFLSRVVHAWFSFEPVESAHSFTQIASSPTPCQIRMTAMCLRRSKDLHPIGSPAVLQIAGPKGATLRYLSEPYSGNVYCQTLASELECVGAVCRVGRSKMRAVGRVPVAEWPNADSLTAIGKIVGNLLATLGHDLFVRHDEGLPIGHCVATVNAAAMQCFAGKSYGIRTIRGCSPSRLAQLRSRFSGSQNCRIQISCLTNPYR
jgi:hypothetical protein